MVFGIWYLLMFLIEHFSRKQFDFTYQITRPKPVCRENWIGGKQFLPKNLI